MPKFYQLDAGVLTGVLDAAAAPETVPDGRRFLLAPDGPDPLFGSTYTNGVWIPPAVVQPAELQPSLAVVLEAFQSMSADVKAVRVKLGA